MYNLPRIKMEKVTGHQEYYHFHYQINISASWTFNLLVACNEQGTSAWFAVIGESFYYAIETWCTSFTMIPSSVMFTGLGIEKQPLNTWTEPIAVVVHAILKEKLYWEKTDTSIACQMDIIIQKLRYFIDHVSETNMMFLNQ